MVGTPFSFSKLFYLLGKSFLLHVVDHEISIWAKRRSNLEKKKQSDLDKKILLITPDQSIEYF